MLTEAILLEQNKRLRKRVEELEDEVFHLRHALGMTSRFKPETGLTATEERLFGSLVKFGAVSREASAALLPERGNRRAKDGSSDIDNLFRVHMTHVRRKVERFGVKVKNRHGFGYYLEASDQAIARGLIA